MVTLLKHLFLMKKEAKQKVEVPEEIEIVEETQIDPTKPRTESEVIELEEKLIETVETFEEVEEELK